MIDLNVEICGIKFRNPVLTAAGPPVKDGNAILQCAKGGAGGIVTKTISTKLPQIPRPCMAEIDTGFMNTELWSELPVKQWIDYEYKIAKQTHLPLIISIGYTASDIANIMPKVEKYADGFEISTHYAGGIKSITAILNTAKKITALPVFIKLSPNVPDIKKFAISAERAGADAIVAINTLGPCMSIDIESAQSYMGSEYGYGWLSGTALKPLAVRCVHDIARSVKIPVIGVGGVSTGRDAVEMFMAGACAVEVCTAAIIHGPTIFKKIVAGIAEFMRAHNYQTISDMKALVLRKRKDVRFMPVPPEIDISKCTLCGLCISSCMYNAIKIEDMRLKIDTNRCFGCGLCVSRCRLTGRNAMNFKK